MAASVGRAGAQSERRAATGHWARRGSLRSSTPPRRGAVRSSLAAGARGLWSAPRAVAVHQCSRLLELAADHRYSVEPLLSRPLLWERERERMRRDERSI